MAAGIAVTGPTHARFHAVLIREALDVMTLPVHERMP
jgi:hypothetical protein